MKSFNKFAAILARVALVLFVMPGNAEEARSDARPESSGQRFVIVFSPHSDGTTYLLDTETGRVWQARQATGAVGEPTVWTYMDRVDNLEQHLEWLRRQKPKGKQNQ